MKKSVKLVIVSVVAVIAATLAILIPIRLSASATTPDETKEQPVAGDYVVSFDLGYNVEHRVTTQTVADGAYAESSQPKRDNYEFVDWYHRGQLFDFTTPIKENMTLLAKWNQVSYTVEFDTCGGDEMATMQVPVNQQLDKNSLIPTWTNHSFRGWFTDAGYTQIFDFSADVNNSNLKLYALWDWKVEYQFLLNKDKTAYSLVSIHEDSQNGTGIAVITLPSEYQGLPVTAVSDSAFENCTTLQSVVIPDSYQSIGKSAFAGCSSLEKVVIADSVTTIDAFAFNQCLSLNQVELSKNLQSIGRCAFRKCESLVTIVIPASVTQTGDHLFTGANQLTIITCEGVIGEGWNPNWNGSTANVIEANN